MKIRTRFFSAHSMPGGETERDFMTKQNVNEAETFRTAQAQPGSGAASGSVSASEVQAILDATDWGKFWQDVAEAAAPEIEAYRQAEARSRNSNHVFV